VKGKRCRCGFATLAPKPRCPRCGKVTSDAEWKDIGVVLSSARLKSPPEGLKVPMALVLVEIDGKGPKVTCWSEDDLVAGDMVALVDTGAGTYTCKKKQEPMAQ